MKKALLVFALVLGFMALASGKEAKAATNGTLKHAYKPYTVTKTRAMRARIDNFAPAQTRLVCVEAFNQANGAKTHLGCLSVPFASYNSDGAWAFEFDTPTYWLAPGNYRVAYTYQDDFGDWHQIKSVNQTVMDGSYRSW